MTKTKETKCSGPFYSSSSSNESRPQNYLTDRYFLDPKPLGSGAYGVVLKATLKSDPTKRYAVKVFKPDEDGQDECQHEASIYQRLGMTESKGFVQLYERGLDVFPRDLPGFDSSRPLRPYLLLTLVEGVNGFRLMSELERHSWSTLLLAFSRLAQQVRHFHLQGHVFRDLKPTNVMFDLSNPNDPKSYVVDMGLVCSIDYSTPHRDKNRSFLATMPYASPDVVVLWAAEQGRLLKCTDQVSAEKEDSAELRFGSDAWALGMVFLELFLMKSSNRHLHVALGELPKRTDKLYDYVHHFFASMRFQNLQGESARNRWRHFIRRTLPDVSTQHRSDPHFQTLLEFLQRLFTYEPKTPKLQVAELEWFALSAQDFAKSRTKLSDTTLPTLTTKFHSHDKAPLENPTSTQLLFEDLVAHSVLTLVCPASPTEEDSSFVETIPASQSVKDAPARDSLRKYRGTTTAKEHLPKLVDSVGEPSPKRAFSPESLSALKRKLANMPNHHLKIWSSRKDLLKGQSPYSRTKHRRGPVFREKNGDSFSRFPVCRTFHRNHSSNNGIRKNNQ